MLLPHLFVFSTSSTWSKATHALDMWSIIQLCTVRMWQWSLCGTFMEQQLHSGMFYQLLSLLLDSSGLAFCCRLFTILLFIQTISHHLHVISISEYGCLCQNWLIVSMMILARVELQCRVMLMLWILLVLCKNCVMFNVVNREFCHCEAVIMCLSETSLLIQYITTCMYVCVCKLFVFVKFLELFVCGIFISDMIRKDHFEKCSTLCICNLCVCFADICNLIWCVATATTLSSVCNR